MRIFLFLTIFTFFANLVYSVENEIVKFGTAKINITPEEPVPMSGYGGRKSLSAGVHDDLYATALYFAAQNNQMLLITADIISFNNELTKELKEKINASTGIPGENMLLTAAHNHGGPVVRAYEKDVPECVDRYVESLKTKILEISEKASQQSIPVSIGYGSGSCKLNINRRAVFADGNVGLGRNPDGPCDHEVSVLKIEDTNGKLLSLFVNWPCHGTASGQQNLKITGDWPGLAARYLNEKLGDDVVVAVTAGASGDINPIYGPNDKFREIETVGAEIGAEVYRIIDAIETYPVKTIDVTNKTLILPGKKRTEDRSPNQTFEKGPDIPVQLSVIKLGNFIFSGISGEVMTQIGMKIKESSPYQGTFVLTHCNGTSGYICTDAAYPEGGYEVQVTKLWQGVEKEITGNVIEMIHSL